jgi:SAM-dependent methyltransferase
MTTDQNSIGKRETAYTTPRPDVCAMIPSSAMAILDVGCSNGALGKALKIDSPGRTVVGMEMDPEFALEAGRRLDKVICADMNRLDWSTAVSGMQFDCIIFADVLEHLIDPQRHIRDAQRFLRPGGCIVMSLPNIRHVSSLSSIFLKGTFPSRSRGIFDKTHLRWFTIGDAKALVADVGMSIEQTSYTLRIGDEGGGLINKALNGLSRAFKEITPLREFLTYQFCLRAITKN